MDHQSPADTDSDQNLSGRYPREHYLGNTTMGGYCTRQTRDLQSHDLTPRPAPHHVPVPLSDPSPSPLELHDPLSPLASSFETSQGEGHYSSGGSSPSSSRSNSLVLRRIPYDFTPSPTSSSSRRSHGRSQGSDEEDIHATYHKNRVHAKQELTRRQRMEAEQRRRDELRESYARLKDVLPVSDQKNSKASLLERATNHILDLEAVNQELHTRLVMLAQSTPGSFSQVEHSAEQFPVFTP